MARSPADATRRLARTATAAVGKAGDAAGSTVGRAGRTAGEAAGSAGTAVGGGDAAGLLQNSLQSLAGTLTERAVSTVTDKVTGTAGRLNEYAEGGGGSLLSALTGTRKLAEGKSPLQAAMSAGVESIKHTAKDRFDDVKEALGGGPGKGGGDGRHKTTGIVEQLDVGVPIRLAYDLWTRFEDWPKFMKKVEQVEQASDEKLRWTGKVFWSRRTWESTILEQVPFERIVWRSKGDKGYIDGAVTFHEITPTLTRIIMVLEYHPRGLFEKTANLWRAVGRRARLEFKHFERHVMTVAVLHPDDVRGWHGEIRDSEVVEDDETARRAEEEQDEYPEDEAGSEVPEDEYPEDEEAQDEGAEDELEEEPEEPEPPRRRPAARRAGARTRTSSRQGART